MSSATPNVTRFVGPVLNMESNTAPSLTDASLNNAYKNRIVTLPDDSKYFVEASGVAVKIFGVGATAGAFAQVVYTNASNPNAATIFLLTTPPVTNYPALAQDSANPAKRWPDMVCQQRIELKVEHAQLNKHRSHRPRWSARSVLNVGVTGDLTLPLANTAVAGASSAYASSSRPNNVTASTPSETSNLTSLGVRSKK